MSSSPFTVQNAVLYYSVGILGSILPALAGSIGILITVINILMTFPPIYLIDEHRVGRKNLMVGSAIVMAIASALLGGGIVYGYKGLSAFCMILMVAGFSFGLGPIPFVILPELVPSRVSTPFLRPSLDLCTDIALLCNGNLHVLRLFQQLLRSVSPSTGQQTLSSAPPSFLSRTSWPATTPDTPEEQCFGSFQSATCSPPSSSRECTATSPSDARENEIIGIECSWSLLSCRLSTS